MRVSPGPDETYVLKSDGTIIDPAIEVTGGSVAPDKTFSGVITDNGNTVVCAGTGYNSHSIVITGTWTGTLVGEITVDGTTWFTSPILHPPISTTSGGVPDVIYTITESGTYQFAFSGAVASYRIRATSAITGTANVYVRFSSANPIMTFNAAQITQNVFNSTVNRTTTNLASGASYTGTAESTLGVAYIQFQIKCDQSVEVAIQQSIDGTNWDIEHREDIPGGHSYADSLLVTAEYYRMVITNIGPSTTAYLRAACYLCPMAEANKPLISGHKMTGWSPDPALEVEEGEEGVFQNDISGNLMVRGQVLTDEGSFHEAFPGTSLQSNISGTTAFKNGESIISNLAGIPDPVISGQYIRLSTDADTALTQIDTSNDLSLSLVEGYKGNTGSGTAVVSNWRQAVGSGGSISVSASKCNIASGGTNAADTNIFRSIDYLPIHLSTYASLSNRRANQTTVIGLQDLETLNTVRAAFVFTGTTNTVVTCVTLTATGETTSVNVTLPAGAITSNLNMYEILVSPRTIGFYINRVKVHSPALISFSNYLALGAYFGISNQAAVTSSTLTIDSVAVHNYNDLRISAHQQDPSKLQTTSNGIYSNLDALLVEGDTSELRLNESRALVNTDVSAINEELGKSFTTRATLNIGTGETNVLLMTNPAGSGKKLKVRRIEYICASSANDITSRVYSQNTLATPGGTAAPIVNKRIGNATASVMVGYVGTITGVTRSTNIVDSAFSNHYGFTHVTRFPLQPIFILDAGTNVVITAQASANATPYILQVDWDEE